MLVTELEWVGKLRPGSWDLCKKFLNFLISLPESFCILANMTYWGPLTKILIEVQLFISENDLSEHALLQVNKKQKEEGERWKQSSWETYHHIY